MSRVIIVGGGASVNDGIALGLWEKIKDEEVWAINSSWEFMEYPPSCIMWVDHGFFLHNKEALLLSHINMDIKLIADYNYGKYRDYPQIKTYETTRNRDDWDKTDKIFKGGFGLTGLFALSLAIKQYDKIYLCGFDWGTPNFRDVNTHFYGKSDKKIYSTGIGKVGLYLDSHSHPHPNVHDFQVYLRTGKVIKNVSPNSNIDYFEKINYSTFFEEIL